MIEFLGALCIIAASTLIGFVLASRYNQRPRQIRQWRSALQSMEAEIIYGRIPVGELAVHLEKQLPQPISCFFQYLQDALFKEGYPLQDAWRQAVLHYWPQTAMKTAEREVVLQFGTTLGTGDVANQKKHIQLALAQLEAEENEARRDQATHEKMMRSLGFLAGLLVVLLLI
ncbi:stage III sporulation protein SpoIIIAB [Sporolactobacillus spathodeae]|uniref:Stage III sporulation protein AB n=1 Tax=Sporolactobacillus spathodeae TaxID=1465502 RepID=A0ABS2QAE5_9BACL|nr:stage III sporulation protein SpoIIIAB [Sporolactobacillus spathodeae]MBM7658693.1 stage III sporulation protein AB [Sporolactobacillus spathodeae]